MPMTVRRWLAKLLESLILKHVQSCGAVWWCDCCINLVLQEYRNLASQLSGGDFEGFSRGLSWIERSSEECCHKWSVLGLTICDSEFFLFTFQWFISYISLHRQL